MNIKNLAERLKDLLHKVSFHKERIVSAEEIDEFKVKHINLLLKKLKELSHHHSLNNIELTLLEKYLGYCDKILEKVVQDKEDQGKLKKLGRQHFQFLHSELAPEKENDFSKGTFNLSVLLNTELNGSETSEKLEFANDDGESKLEEETKIKNKK